MSVGAVVACCALAAACTQEPAQTSSPSPTPLATTPRESQIERQMRLDYEAAEEAYRANIAEQDRQSQLVALQQATSCIEGDGDWRLFAVLSLAGLCVIIREAGWQAHRGTTNIRGVGRDRMAGGQVRLTACEDGSAVTIRRQRRQRM